MNKQCGEKTEEVWHKWYIQQLSFYQGVETFSNTPSAYFQLFTPSHKAFWDTVSVPVLFFIRVMHKGLSAGIPSIFTVKHIISPGFTGIDAATINSPYRIDLGWPTVGPKAKELLHNPSDNVNSQRSGRSKRLSCQKQQREQGRIWSEGTWRKHPYWFSLWKCTNWKRGKKRRDELSWLLLKPSEMIWRTLMVACRRNA